MPRTFREYLHRLRRSAGPDAARQNALREELADHLAESIRTLRREGLSLREAMQAALADLGDAGQLAEAMRLCAALHRREQRRRRRQWAVAMCGIAASLALLWAGPMLSRYGTGEAIPVALNGPGTGVPALQIPIHKETTMRGSTLVGGAISVMVGATLASEVQAVPQAINHQGVISVNGTRYTGTGLFKFAILDGTNNQHWSNDGESPPGATVSLTVTDGVYNVRLGDTTLTGMTESIPPTIFASGDLKLRIWFNDGQHGEQVLSPDHPLSTSPYAFTVADGAVTQAKLGSDVGVWNKSGVDLAYGTGQIKINATSSTDGSVRMIVSDEETPWAFMSIKQHATRSDSRAGLSMQTYSNTTEAGSPNRTWCLHALNNYSSWGSGFGIFEYKDALGDGHACNSPGDICYAPRLFVKADNGYVGINTTGPQQQLDVNGVVRCQSLQQTSSRALKQDIAELDTLRALHTLNGLKPVTFRYRDASTDPEPHVGFIAEDVPALLAGQDHKSIKPNDIVAVLTKVVQEQQQLLESQGRQIEQMRQALHKHGITLP